MPAEGNWFSPNKLPTGEIFDNQGNEDRQNFLKKSQLKDGNNLTDNDYGISSSDWYQTFPYRFIVFKDETNVTPHPFYIYSLPIPPEQFVIKPIYASDAIATMGGVIEECSKVTFWQIIMSGLMPLAVNRSTANDDTNVFPDYANPAKNFRDTISTTGLITSVASSLAGPLMSVFGTSANVANSDNVLQGMEAAIEPHLPYSESAVNENNNGYSEIYDMQRFFLAYEYIKSRQNKEDDSTYTLFFENIKDNQRFRVIPNQTDFIKTSKTPYGYRYQIVLKGWELQDVTFGDKQQLAQDRFQNDLKYVSTLSATQILNGVTRATRAIAKISNGDLSTFAPTPSIL